LTRSQIAAKSAEVPQAARVEQLEKANAPLHVKLDVAQLKLAEVERRELALTAIYEDLKKDFEHLHSSRVAMVAEKAKVKKTEPAKLQRF
jgi:hypothetical protein